MNSPFTPSDAEFLKRAKIDVGFAVHEENERRMAQFDANSLHRSETVKGLFRRNMELQAEVQRIGEEREFFLVMAMRAERRAFWAQIAAGFFGLLAALATWWGLS